MIKKIINNSVFTEFHFGVFFDDRPGIFYCVRWERLVQERSHVIRIMKGSAGAYGPWEDISFGGVIDRSNPSMTASRAYLSGFLETQIDHLTNKFPRI